MDSVALGKGHESAHWTKFLPAPHEVNPEMWASIEHEDVPLGRIVGLEVASAVLDEANDVLEVSVR